MLACGLPGGGELGLGMFCDDFEFFDETDTLRRIPNLRRLSAPALAFDVDLPIAPLFGNGELGGRG